ncbi:uncharacterized protein DS421_3g89980 [Arachis hypogaea]|nr:uncharacterized protein DS421_3g89980 [Arachis hypogaea]
MGVGIRWWSSLGTYDDKLGRVHKFCPEGVPRLMSIAATDSRIQNLQRRELRKASDVQETLWSTGSIGATRCLRFAKHKMVPFKLLTLRNDTATVAISRSSDFHVVTCLHVAPTNVLIGKYTCTMCTRCLKFARCIEASSFRWMTPPRGIDRRSEGDCQLDIEARDERKTEVNPLLE